MATSRYFGSRLAVDGVSFVARRGDIVGLVGPNGGGKTTVIRMLTTMLAPSAGEFSVAGYPATAQVGRRFEFRAVLRNTSGSTTGPLLQAVSAGTFAGYAVVVPSERAGALVVSPQLRLTVAERRTHNAGGSLPVVIAVPAVLGLASLAVRTRSRAGRLAR